jgi:hypothetical protein
LTFLISSWKIAQNMPYQAINTTEMALLKVGALVSLVATKPLLTYEVLYSL